ncbi:hypothetical protein LCGC14_1802840 [marine sediment metagenome]|uniref:Uncharacterized protein n=1 Tax=marine sediment metagenome TaxID=412755 RepID=A0A0F9GNW7_9ZZZZ
MTGKTQGERIVRLETYYVQVNDSLKEIKGHLKTQNGRVEALTRWQQRIIGAGLLAAFVLTVGAGVFVL